MTHRAKANVNPLDVYDKPGVPEGAPRICGLYVETECGIAVHRSEIAVGEPECPKCLELIHPRGEAELDVMMENFR